MSLARKLIQELNENDKKVIKSWADDAFIIHQDLSLSRIEKLKKYRSLENSNTIIKNFYKSIFLISKKQLWDKRSIPGRFAITGLILGTTISGGSMAGIATAGSGIGVPIFLLTTAGGALLGTIVKELKKD